MALRFAARLLRERAMDACALGAAALLLSTALPACRPQAPPAGVEPVRVRASVERADVTPGQPFDLVVEVDRSDDVTVDLPEVGAGIRGLLILDEKHETEDLGGRTLQRTTYALRAPLAGTYLVPGVEGSWKAADGRTGTVGTGPILVEAVRAAGQEGSGEEELRDLKPAREPPAPAWPWLAAAAALLLAVAGVLVAWLLRRRRTAAASPPPPPEEVALRELAALLESDLLRPDGQGPFAYRLSEILRRYLEARFAFRAWRMTTQEVLRAMPRELASRRDTEAAIRDVLEASDCVKFAGEPVPLPELRRWVEQARDVVDATRPRDEQGPGGEATA